MPLRWLLRHHLHGNRIRSTTTCMEIGVHRHIPVEPGEEAAHESQSIFCYSGSYSEQRPSRMCGHRAHNLLVLRSPLFSFTLRPRAQICVGDMRVSFLQAKGRHIICQNKGPAVARSARPAPPALSERNECVKDR